MNTKNYYLHGTAGYKGAYMALDRISSIFHDGKIKKNKNVECLDHSIQNGLKRNYLCDPQKPIIDGLNSAYDLYISRGPSLALSRDIEVITPHYINQRGYLEMESTNLYDEVRTDYDISLDNLCFLLLPIELVEQYYKSELSKGHIRKELKHAILAKLLFMKTALKSAKHFDSTLPIIDTMTHREITEEQIDLLEESITQNKERQLLLK